MVAGAIRAGRAFVELFADPTKLERGLRRAAMKMQAFGRGVQAVGAQIAKLGVISAAPFALSTKIFSSFESTLTAVRARLGLTEQAIAPLEKKIRELGASTVFSASEVAEASFEFTKAGVSMEDQLEALGPALDLAVAGQLEMAEATSVVTQIMSSMKIPIEEVAEVTDALGFASNTANTDVLLMGEALGKVSGLAKSLGVEYHELLPAIAQVQQAGLAGSEAGTGLRGAFLALTKTTPQVQQALHKLGVDMENMERLDIVQVFTQLRDATADLDKLGRTRALSDIFEAKQLAAAIALMDNIDAVADNIKRAGEEGEGFNRKIGAAQMETLEGQMAQIKAAFEDIAIEIGKALVPLLREWSGAIKDAAAFLGNWIKGNKDSIPTIAKWVAIVTAAGAAVVALGIAITSLGTVLGAAAAAIGVVVSLIGALFTPIGAAVAVIAGLVVAFTDVKKAGKEAFGALAKQAMSMKEIFDTAWGGIVDAIMAGELELATEIAWTGVRATWKQGVLFLRGLWEDFKNFFARKITAAQISVAKVLAQSWGGLRLMWSKVVTSLTKLWLGFTTGVKKGWEKTRGVLEGIAAAFEAQLFGGNPAAAAAEAGRRAAARIAEIEAAAKAELDAINAKATAEEKAILDKHNAMLKALDDEEKAEEKARQRKKAAALQDIKDELDAEKKKLNELAEKARARRQAQQAGPEQEEAAGGLWANILVPMFEELKKKGGGLLAGRGGRQTLDPRAQAEVSGTFNAAAIRGLGGESIQRQQLGELQAINKGVKKVAKGGAAFA